MEFLGIKETRIEKHKYTNIKRRAPTHDECMNLFDTSRTKRFEFTQGQDLFNLIFVKLQREGDLCLYFIYHFDQLQSLFISMSKLFVLSVRGVSSLTEDVKGSRLTTDRDRYLGDLDPVLF